VTGRNCQAAVQIATSHCKCVACPQHVPYPVTRVCLHICNEPVCICSLYKGRFTHRIPCPCRSPAMPCREGFRMCLFHLIYTVRPCLIHTCHAAPMPCSDLAVLLKATAQHGRRETACGLPARVRLLPATTRSSTNIIIRNIPILLTTIHTYEFKEWKQHTTKKDYPLNCWTSSSDISGYHADFHEGHSTVGAGQGCDMACVN
jgi:hypothetical protein